MKEYAVVKKRSCRIPFHWLAILVAYNKKASHGGSVSVTKDGKWWKIEWTE